METIETRLHDLPIFEGLQPADLELIAGCASNVRFREGEPLFREGDEANSFYVLRHCTVALEPVGGGGLEPAPGQFTMLYAFGIGEVPISVSGDVGGPLVHTVRAVGSVTQALCAARRGSVLGVRGPFGNAWPVADVLG